MSGSTARKSGIFGVLKRSVKEFSADDMLTYAAAVSYQVFFSLFPFVIFLLALLGVLNLSGFFDTLLQQSRTVLPQSAFGLVEGIVSQVRNQSGGGILGLPRLHGLFSFKPQHLLSV